MSVERRKFLALVGGAIAARPLVAWAQVTPTIAYMSARSEESDVAMLAALRRGLAEQGYAEGRNLAIEYRFAGGDYGRMPGLLTELTRRRMAVIVVAGVTSNEGFLRQMRASPLPLVFNIGPDPVEVGLVDSLARPGGNVTGISTLVGFLTGKQIGLLQELVPAAKTIALLWTPGASGMQSGSPYRDAIEATGKLGLQLRVLEAASDSELEKAFAGLDQQPVDGIVAAASPYFVTRARQIADHVSRVADGYRQMGIYAGRILKGDKPADLPVFQPTKFQFVINLKTAKALGIDIPAKLLALSDEVIE